jgi:hypothetical protein
LTLRQYKTGKRRDDVRPIENPRTVALACAALRLGLPPEGDAATL